MINIDQFPNLYTTSGDIKDINNMVVNRNILKDLIRKANAYDEIIEDTKELIKDEISTN